MTNNVLLQLPSASMLLPSRPVLTSVALSAKFVSWKSRTKYTTMPVKMRKSGGRNHTGKNKGKKISAVKGKNMVGPLACILIQAEECS